MGERRGQHPPSPTNCIENSNGVPSSIKIEDVLTKEASHIVMLLQLHEYEKQLREQLINKTKKIVSDCLPLSQVELYGSWRTGLSLPSSDLDFVVISSENDSNQALLTVSEAIEKSELTRTACYHTARVPVVKFYCNDTELRGDLTVNVQTWNNSVELVRSLLEKHSDYHARDLIMLLKMILVQSKSNEVHKGGLSSYGLSLMVFAYIRRAKAKRQSSHLGPLFMGFLDHYRQGGTFDPKTMTVDVNNDEGFRIGVMKTMSNRSDLGTRVVWCVQDPLNKDNNVTEQSFSMESIVACFSDMHKKINNIVNNIPEGSGAHSCRLLSRIIDGLPVFLEERKVTLDKCNSPSLVISRIAPPLPLQPTQLATGLPVAVGMQKPLQPHQPMASDMKQLGNTSPQARMDPQLNPMMNSGLQGMHSMQRNMYSPTGMMMHSPGFPVPGSPVQQFSQINGLPKMYGSSLLNCPTTNPLALSASACSASSASEMSVDNINCSNSAAGSSHRSSIAGTPTTSPKCDPKQTLPLTSSAVAAAFVEGHTNTNTNTNTRQARRQKGLLLQQQQLQQQLQQQQQQHLQQQLQHQQLQQPLDKQDTSDRRSNNNGKAPREVPQQSQTKQKGSKGRNNKGKQQQQQQLQLQLQPQQQQQHHHNHHHYHQQQQLQQQQIQQHHQQQYVQPQLQLQQQQQQQQQPQQQQQLPFSPMVPFQGMQGQSFQFPQHMYHQFRHMQGQKSLPQTGIAGTPHQPPQPQGQPQQAQALSQPPMQQQPLPQPQQQQQPQQQHQMQPPQQQTLMPSMFFPPDQSMQNTMPATTQQRNTMYPFMSNGVSSPALMNNLKYPLPYSFPNTLSQSNGKIPAPGFRSGPGSTGMPSADWNTNLLVYQQQLRNQQARPQNTSLPVSNQLNMPVPMGQTTNVPMPGTHPFIPNLADSSTISEPEPAPVTQPVKNAEPPAEEPTPEEEESASTAVTAVTETVEESKSPPRSPEPKPSNAKKEVQSDLVVNVGNSFSEAKRRDQLAGGWKKKGQSTRETSSDTAAALLESMQKRKKNPPKTIVSISDSPPKPTSSNPSEATASSKVVTLQELKESHRTNVDKSGDSKLEDLTAGFLGHRQSTSQSNKSNEQGKVTVSQAKPKQGRVGSDKSSDGSEGGSVDTVGHPDSSHCSGNTNGCSGTPSTNAKNVA